MTIIDYTQSYLQYYEFLRIINTNKITTFFQPIINLKDGTVLGYEALSRGPEKSDFHSPLVLLDFAKRNDMLWDLEYTCRQRALQSSQTFISKHQLLFINVDANIFNDPAYQSGLTKKSLADYHFSADNIVFEITEHSGIDSVELYQKALNHYKSQGYKIAVDDVGTGYSNLMMLIRTRPHFLKVDMELVRDIDKDYTKQSLIKTFKSFCESSNIKLIAEGIETAMELETLINIGVDYGQGYYIKRPSADDFEVPAAVKEEICTISSVHDTYSTNFPLSLQVGSLASEQLSVDIQATGYDLEKIFRKNPSVLGVPVLQNHHVRGLVMRNKFYSFIGRQYGLELFLKKTVDKLMDCEPLVVDYYMPIKEVSKYSINRSDETIYDHLIITKNNQYFGIVTIKDLLESTSQIELTIAKHANPLTGLPGNILIEKNLQECLRSNRSYCILYLDLDNFKPFNDQYGFEKGDAMISMTGQIIRRLTDQFLKSSAFIGHIGGDDFVVTAYCSQKEATDLAQTIIEEFEDQKWLFFSEKDLEKGYFYEKNRRGTHQKFPLTNLSIAVIDSENHSFSTIYEISEEATKLKAMCKKYDQSICLAR